MFKKLTSRRKLRYLKRLFKSARSGDVIYLIDNNLSYSIFGSKNFKTILEGLRLKDIKLFVVITRSDYDKRSRFIVTELADWTIIGDISLPYCFATVITDTGNEVMYLELPIKNKCTFVQEAKKPLDRILSWAHKVYERKFWELDQYVDLLMSLDANDT